MYLFFVTYNLFFSSFYNVDIVGKLGPLFQKRITPSYQYGLGYEKAQAGARYGNHLTATLIHNLMFELPCSQYSKLI